MREFTPQMKLVISLSSLQSKLSKRIDQKLSLHGISFTEFMVLRHLNTANNETLRRIDLAEHIGLSASGVTRLLLPMEKIGLVQKATNPRDARVSLVKITATGKQIFEDASISFKETTESIIQPLNTKQIANFSKLLAII